MNKFKRIFLILLSLIVCMTSMYIPASAEEIAEIHNISELKELFKNGGTGILVSPLDTLDDELVIDSFTNVILYVEGIPLIINPAYIKIAGSLTVIDKNQGIPTEMIFTGPEERVYIDISGKLILNHVDFHAGKIFGGGTIYNSCGSIIVDEFDGKYIEFNAGAYMYALPHNIPFDKFAEILESGKLINVTSDNYESVLWRDETGHEVTEWADDASHRYTPVWKDSSEGTIRNTASAFGDGSVWIVTTSLFAISTVIFAVLYFKSKKNND